MNRREFIALAGAAAVLPQPVTRGVVLFDARYGDSRQLAAVLAGRGFEPLATNQDVVRLWYESAVLRTAVQVAGVTPHSDLEILRRLLGKKRLVSQRAVRAHDRRGALVSWHFA